MQTYQQPYLSIAREREARPSVFSRFNAWCAGQEKSRFGWTAVSIAIHGCALTPITLLAIVTSGNNTILFCLAMYAMAMSLITNLAALPTRITIPVFFLSVLIDMGVLGWCAFS